MKIKVHANDIKYWFTSTKVNLLQATLYVRYTDQRQNRQQYKLYYSYFIESHSYWYIFGIQIPLSVLTHACHHLFSNENVKGFEQFL